MAERGTDMKPLFGEEYYRKYWSRFLEPVPGGDFIDLEGELTKRMNRYREAGIPENALQVVEKVEAQKLAARCKELVTKEMGVVRDIEAGRASLGYTTQSQEIHARGELRKRFEFNCLQYRDFRKAHNL